MAETVGKSVFKSGQKSKKPPKRRLSQHIVFFACEVNEKVVPAARHKTAGPALQPDLQVGENPKKRFVLRFGLLSPSQPIR